MVYQSQYDQTGGTQYGAYSPATGGNPTPPVTPQGSIAEQQQQAQLGALGGLYNQAVVQPYNAYANQQVGDLQSQLALLLAGNQQQTGYANQQYQSGLAGLGIQGAGLGIQQGALARQLPYMSAMHGLDLQNLQSEREMAQLGSRQQQQSLEHATVAGGAVGSVGSEQGYKDITQQLNSALAGIGRQETGSNLSYQEQVAQHYDAEKQLGLMGQQLGLSKTDITNRLQQTLDQIGIGGMMSVNQIMGEISKIQQGQLSPLSGMIGQIMAAAGMPIPGGQ